MYAVNKIETFRQVQEGKFILTVKSENTIRTSLRRDSVHCLKWIFFCLVFAFNVARPSITLAANSLSQFGITWTFDRDYTVGQFANGDYWVVGPVNITDITRPAGSVERDGSMINPIPGWEHGYDSRVNGYYTPSLNVANFLPLTVNPNESLISTISGPLSRPVLKTAAVLTVLGDIPLGGSFRPPYAGNEKPIYSTNNLKRELLLSLNPVASTPSLSSVERIFERPWIDHRLGWQGDYLHPDENMENYGGGIARDTGIGALRLLLNDPIEDKETLLIRYIQLGIDFYGNVKNGAYWGDLGGTIGVGRKIPILFAGLMLNNSEMKNVAINYNTRVIFEEDAQTFYLTQAERDGTYHPDNCLHPDYCYPGYYDNVPLESPNWGERHYRWLTTSYNYLPGKINYLGITHKSTTGAALAVHLLGIEELWNYDPFLDWTDRCRSEGVSGTWGSAFADDMWDTYRAMFGPIWPHTDSIPPLAPTNLISTAQTENSISLSWTAPGPASDGDLASSYKVYRNGTLVSTITNTSFQDSGLAAGISYDYKVYSVDDAGNKSTSAATGTFSTLADTTHPVISSVQTSNVTASQATITWNTNENSTSQVEYGLSASYGNTTNLNSTLVTSHSVVLTWLSPSTTYHYRVKSKDASGNESISQDDTFTTIGVKYSLTVSSTIGGSVTTPGEPGPYQYDQGTEVSIEATEDPNYRFVNWTGTAVNAGKVANPDSASTTVTMDADYTIQANFVVDETDETDPEVTNLSPLADSIQVPLNTLITLDITDSGDGIDPDLVTIKVNNITVYTGDTTDYNSVSGHCYRTGTNANYRFIYQSEQNFGFDQTINITVNATDLASNGMDEYSYSFTTEMRSFGDNIKVNSNTLSSNSMPVTVRDSGGNIWTAWHTGTTGSRDICIGTLTAEAESFSNITKIRDNTTDQCNPAIAVDSDDKLYVAWQDNRRGNWDIYISTSNDGTNWSAETRVTDSNDNQINPAIVVNSSNNAYIVWEDDRNGNDNQDIYVATSNNDFVTKTIAQITSDSSNQAEPAIAADSANTIYIVWTDTRNSKNDIYGAASNNGPWTNIPIVNTGDSQSSPAIAAEAVGSILHLVWVDDRPGDDDIYYAQTDGGLPGSPLTGSSIIDDPDEDQLNPVVAVTGSTGNNLQVFACWQDERNADDDLYLVEISSGNGTNVFVGDDRTNSGQAEPAIGIDANDYPYLVWTDSRNTNTDIYYAGSTFAESTVLASNNISTSSTVTVGTPLNAINSVDDVSVVVPAGAYPCDIEITISKITNPLAFAMQCLGAYDFGPSGIDFSQSVTVTIPYNYTGSEDVALAYWYNSLTDALSQQGITDVETIEVSSSLHALRFKTTHFTPFYVFLVSAGGAAASGGGGGGGCSMSPDSQASVVELILPYIGLTVAMVVLKMRDRRKRKALNITKSEC